MASEEDLRVARDICFRADVGESVQQTILIKLIAADRAAARAETWKEAIELAKSVECLEGFSGHWQNGHSQAKAVIVGLLEAVAGSKTKVFSREDEQKNQG